MFVYLFICVLVKIMDVRVTQELNGLPSILHILIASMGFLGTGSMQENLTGDQNQNSLIKNVVSCPPPLPDTPNNKHLLFHS